MSTPYQRGAAFEYRVKAELEKEGWFVMRSPGSKSPLDLLAVKLDCRGTSWVWMVQCKLRGVLRLAETLELKALAAKHGAYPILAYTLRPRGAVHYCIVDDRTRGLLP